MLRAGFTLLKPGGEKSGQNPGYPMFPHSPVTTSKQLTVSTPVMRPPVRAAGQEIDKHVVLGGAAHVRIQVGGRTRLLRVCWVQSRDTGDSRVWKKGADKGEQVCGN